MGIPTDPASYLPAPPANQCPHCYPPGETPDKLYLCTSEIAPGDLWVPGDGGAMNGCYEMTTAGPSQWDGVPAAGELVAYTSGPGFAEALVSRALIGHFASFAEPICTRSFDNMQVNPAINHFYGGHAYILQVAPSASWTIEELMELLNMDHLDHAKCEVYPLDDAIHVVTHFCQKHGDVIRVLTALTPPGVICLWFGPIVDIPHDWKLCDGNNDTPDLRNTFLIGAGNTYNPNNSAGSTNHDHQATTDAHNHTLPAGTDIAAGVGFSSTTSTDPDTLTTDPANHLPEFHSLAFIQKI